MDIVLKYTRHQTARGAYCDAEVGDKMYLFKEAATLQLTYQIRLLAFRAFSTGKILIIQIPKTTALSIELKQFRRANEKCFQIERV